MSSARNAGRVCSHARPPARLWLAGSLPGKDADWPPRLALPHSSPMSERGLLLTAGAVADLARLSACRLVHSDVNLDNIMATSEGVKLLDVGLVQKEGLAPARQRTIEGCAAVPAAAAAAAAAAPGARAEQQPLHPRPLHAVACLRLRRSPPAMRLPRRRSSLWAASTSMATCPARRGYSSRCCTCWARGRTAPHVSATPPPPQPCMCLPCPALPCPALPYPATLHCTALHCTALHCTALRCAALRCAAPCRSARTL